MLEFDNIRLELEGYLEPINTLKDSLHIDSVNTKISELQNRTQEPDFWNNVDKAQALQVELGRLQKKVDSYNKLYNDREDLLALCELANEDEDLSSLEELTLGLGVFKDEFEKLRLETLLTGQYDKNNAILTLHAGEGGTEAMDWTEMLSRMYTRWGEAHGYEVKMTDFLDGEEAGLKSVTLFFRGENAYGFLRSEHGVHRLVRISPFDSSGRRHTSFASMEVMPELDEASDDIKIDPKDLRVDTYRSTGKGGQHINKTDSAVRITHLPTGIVCACQSERSQVQNRETAMAELRAELFKRRLEEKNKEVSELKGEQLSIAWGSQIRSYVFCPYTLVKDHRTGFEEVNVDAVMDGKLDGFINAFLSGMKIEK